MASNDEETEIFNLEVRRCEMLTLSAPRPRFTLLLINAHVVAVQSKITRIYSPFISSPWRLRHSGGTLSVKGQGLRRSVACEM